MEQGCLLMQLWFERWMVMHLIYSLIGYFWNEFFWIGLWLVDSGFRFLYFVCCCMLFVLSWCFVFVVWVYEMFIGLFCCLDVLSHVFDLPIVGIFLYRAGTVIIFIQRGGDGYHIIRTHGYPLTSLAFAVDHVKRFIYVEAKTQNDIN